ncbi:MAG: extracellular solute-binding protein [Anaerolineae bacterium]|nr:extracellular solute-binding protein [Anaerolineae bacterium]MDW8098061.1 extracellular solute-binding protein [Anaerolineae bacterium]
MKQDLRQVKLSRREFLRRAGVLGFAVGALSALGGCVVPTPAPAAPAVEKAPAPAEKKVVKFAQFYTLIPEPNRSLNLKWIEKTIQAFEAENPDVKVELEEFKWDQIDQRSILDYQAGIPHDVFLSSPQLMAKHLDVGDFLDMTPYIQKWPESELKDLNWSPGWKAGNVGGQQIGIATGVHTRTNVYRRDLYQAAGLDPDKPITTLEEAVEAARATTTADVWGMGMFLGASRATIELYVAPLVWHFGGDIWDAETKKASFAGEAGVQAVQTILDWIYKDKITPEFAITGTYDERCLGDFINGKVATAWGFGSYWIAAVNEKGWFKDCFPPKTTCMPDVAGVMVVPTSVKAQFTNAWCLSIHKLSPNPDLAMKLIEFAMKAEMLVDYPDAGLPARLSMWETPEFQTPFYQIWLEAAKNGRPMPPTAYYPELADTVSAAVQEVVTKKGEVEATLKKFEDEWNSKFAGK